MICKCTPNTRHRCALTCMAVRRWWEGYTWCFQQSSPQHIHRRPQPHTRCWRCTARCRCIPLSVLSLVSTLLRQRSTCRCTCRCLLSTRHCPRTDQLRCTAGRGRALGNTICLLSSLLVIIKTVMTIHRHLYGLVSGFLTCHFTSVYLYPVT